MRKCGPEKSCVFWCFFHSEGGWKNPFITSLKIKEKYKSVRHQMWNEFVHIGILVQSGAGTNLGSCQISIKDTTKRKTAYQWSIRFCGFYHQLLWRFVRSLLFFTRHYCMILKENWNWTSERICWVIDMVSIFFFYSWNLL